MIIGISGKTQSGKNYVASLINYVITIESNNIGEESENNFTYYRYYPFGKYDIFQEHAFANKVKEVTSVLTGCDIELLDSSEFKNKIISDDLPITYRELLIIIGNDFGRNTLSPNIWINSLLDKYEDHMKWLITDVRYPNEVEAIHDKDGIVIRCARPITDRFPKYQSLEDIKYNNPKLYDVLISESETSLDDYDHFDYTHVASKNFIDNYNSIKRILIKSNIL